MDLNELTTVIAAAASALGAGTVSGLSNVAKGDIEKLYQAVKNHLFKNYGGSGSKVMQAFKDLQEKPKALDNQQKMKDALNESNAIKDDKLKEDVNQLQQKIVNMYGSNYKIQFLGPTFLGSVSVGGNMVMGSPNAIGGSSSQPSMAQQPSQPLSQRQRRDPWPIFLVTIVVLLLIIIGLIGVIFLGGKTFSVSPSQQTPRQSASTTPTENPAATATPTKNSVTATAASEQTLKDFCLEVMFQKGSEAYNTYFTANYRHNVDLTTFLNQWGGTINSCNRTLLGVNGDGNSSTGTVVLDIFTKGQRVYTAVLVLENDGAWRIDQLTLKSSTF